MENSTVGSFTLWYWAGAGHFCCQVLRPRKSSGNNQLNFEAGRSKRIMFHEWSDPVISHYHRKNVRNSIQCWKEVYKIWDNCCSENTTRINRQPLRDDPSVHSCDWSNRSKWMWRCESMQHCVLPQDRMWQDGNAGLGSKRYPWLRRAFPLSAVSNGRSRRAVKRLMLASRGMRSMRVADSEGRVLRDIPVNEHEVTRKIRSIAHISLVHIMTVTIPLSDRYEPHHPNTETLNHKISCIYSNLSFTPWRLSGRYEPPHAAA
jgi:hypothetical protein